MSLVQPNKFDGVSHRLVLERWIQKYGFTTMAEVGVKKGRTLLYLLQARPELHMTAVDTWDGGNAPLLPALRRVVDEKYAGRVEFLHGRSVEQAERVPDGSLDLVFIDADHSEASVWADIVAWKRKVRVGGILCGHDVNQPQVKKVVESLCPGWSEHDQAVWAFRVTRPRIIAGIPYADDRNLGRACNEFMERLKDGEWACLLDHDATFTTPEWHRQLTEAVMQRPDGVFTAMTNRIRCPYQLVRGVDSKNHDIAYHREIGRRLLEDQRLGIKDVTNPKGRTPSGLIFVLSKQAWKEAGGFPEGLHYVDRIMWLALSMAGWRWLLLEKLYLYHWHRAGHEPFQDGKWATEHQVPGRGLWRLMNTEPLPVYGSKLVAKSEGESYRFECQTEVEQTRVQTMFTKEPGTVRWLRNHVRAGDVVYDIGANIGQYTLIASKRVGPEGHVYAFEPHVLTASSLLKNIQLNGCTNVTVVTTPLDGEHRAAAFSYKHLLAGTSGSQFGHTREETGGEFEPAASALGVSTTLDWLIDTKAIRPPNVIKLDVDGNEGAVLHGMRYELEKPGLRTIQVEQHPQSAAEVSDALEAAGFRQTDRHITSLGQEAIAQGVSPDKVFYNAVFERGGHAGNSQAPA